MRSDTLASDDPVTAGTFGEEPTGPLSGPLAGDPVVTLAPQLPSVATTSTDVPLIFSTAEMNPIQVGDGYAVTDQVTLSVTAGTLTLATRDGHL